MDFHQELKLFAVKLSIVAALFFIPIGATLVVLNAAISSVASHLIMEADSSYRGNWLAETAAKMEGMNPERREMLHRDIRAIVTQLQPFIEDLRPLLSTGDNCAAKPNGSP